MVKKVIFSNYKISLLKLQSNSRGFIMPRDFRTHTRESLSNLSYKDGNVGPGLDTYVPMVDLNAQSEKPIKKTDLDQIERYADRLFASLGIDVEFTRHFLDRVNDARNKKSHPLNLLDCSNSHTRNLVRLLHN